MKKPLLKVLTSLCFLSTLLLTMNYLHGQEALLESGDFIFIDLECGPTCEAIENVSLQQFGVKGPRLSHVGVIERLGHSVQVWEAWPTQGVQAISLREFLSRPHKAAYRAPLSESFRGKADLFLKRLKSFRGIPYDASFLLGKDALYCSELIYWAWPEVFSLRPMFFGNVHSSDFLVWQSYYHQRWLAVPAGQPGISPLGIYLQGLHGGIFALEQIQIISGE